LRISDDQSPNKTLEPTRVGALSSAVAVHVFWSRVAQLTSEVIRQEVF